MEAPPTVSVILLEDAELSRTTDDMLNGLAELREFAVGLALFGGQGSLRGRLIGVREQVVMQAQPSPPLTNTQARILYALLREGAKSATDVHAVMGISLKTVRKELTPLTGLLIIDSGMGWRREVDSGGAARLATLQPDL